MTTARTRHTPPQNRLRPLPATVASHASSQRWPGLLLLAATTFIGCNTQQKQIAAQAELACRYGQLTRYDVSNLPVEAASALAIRSQDLRFMKWKEDQKSGTSNGFEHMGKALGEAMVQGLKPGALAMVEARARHTTCTLGEVQIQGNTATVQITQTSPVLDGEGNVFSILSEISKYPTSEEQISAAEKLFANTPKTSSLQAQLTLVKEGDRWTLSYKLPEQELEQLETKLTDLKSQLEILKGERLELAKFEVKEARFYRKADYYIVKPFIEMTVINGTSRPISRAYFSGKILSPGRAVPWLEEDFNFTISGGLEPGEKRRWTLEPNMFSAWGKVEPGENAFFEVVPVRLDGADGQKLFSTEGDTALQAQLDDVLQSREALQSLMELAPTSAATPKPSGSL